MAAIGYNFGQIQRAACVHCSDRTRSRAPSSRLQETGMGFLAGKRFLVTGLLSSRSIAYGISRALK
ncbi:MAG: hypothetical protein ACREUZ_10680, partial [Burkholderiales bacterium]